MTRFALLLPLVLLVACRGESEAELLAKARAELARPDAAAATIHLKNALEKNPDAAEARLLLGRALMLGGDAASAQIELRKALVQASLADQAVPELVRAMVAQGEGVKAVAEFADRTLGNPAADAELKTLLAVALAGLGHPAQARASLGQALQALPGYAPAEVLTARLEAGEGQVDAAIRRLDEVLARHPGHEGAGLLKGDLLVQARRDTAGALALFREVRGAHPRSVPAHVAVVGLLLAQGRLAEAKADFAALQKLSPRHPDTQYLEANLALAAKDFKAAREIAERLLAAAPGNVRVLLLAGAAEMGQQRFTLASGLFARALKVQPESGTVRQVLAQSLMKSGQADKALEVLKPLLDDPRTDATSLALAGQAWLLAGDSARAEATFQRALKATPGDSRLRTALALAQLTRGDHQPAMAQLEAITRGDSGGQADLVLISARLRRNDLPGALAAIDALQRKQPDQPLPLVLRGRVQLQQGDAAAARASFEGALKLQAGHLPALTSLAALDAEAGQVSAARQRLEDLIKAEPGHVKARLALVDLDRRLGAPDDALVAQLKEAVRADPTDPAPRLALVDRLLASRDVPAAQAAAQDASAALPDDLAIMDALGLAQLAAGDSQRALSTYKRLSAMQPSSPMPLARLADAHLAGKDLAGARAALKQALEIQPDHLMSLRGMALLAQLDQRPQEALDIARGLQKRLPKDPAGHALEGELESRSGRWAAAAAAYAAALQRRADPDLVVRLHASLLRAGKAAEAERVAADWQKSHPKDTTLLMQQGDAEAAARNWARAEARYHEALALQPRHAVAMNNIAFLLAVQKKPGAVAMAERALAILPDRASLLDTLATALEAEDQLAKAIEAQKRAAELDPRDPMLRLRLAQLHLKKGNKSDARELLDPLARLGPSFPGQAEVGRLKAQL